jgi:hypothetical protein
MSKSEEMIRDKIHRTGMTSTIEALVMFKSFPKHTKKVIRKMIYEGYNISILRDATDLSYFWLDCKENVIFPTKRLLN